MVGGTRTSLRPNYVGVSTIRNRDLGGKNAVATGIGIDIERVARFRGKTKPDLRLLSIGFSARERAYCRGKADPAIHFAGTFAAKEAALKAAWVFRTGEIRLSDFEVAHRSDGSPTVKYSGKNQVLRSLHFVLSISHTKDYAVAVVLIPPAG
jgi:holo-[acyl-carrier protein] synthase